MESKAGASPEQGDGRPDVTAPRVLVIGHQAGGPPPGLPEAGSGASYVLTDDTAVVRANLGDCDVVFHVGPPRDALRDSWAVAGRLRWVQVAGVGVDWALFPELIESGVVLTNSRGVFDTSMPEYVLSLMLALVKDLPGTVRAQQDRRWEHRLLRPLAGRRAVIVGAGSIGRATGRLLRAVGLAVTLVGRGEREGAPEDGRIRAVADLRGLLASADWLVLVTPLTAETRGLVGARELASLPAGARVVNIGRGPVLMEGALIESLRTGKLAGAALDVFEQEPLPADSPLWAMPNVIVSPHIGGDISDTPAVFTDAFLANLERYMRGQPLQNVVDKRLGYVPSGG
jgi:phosphoglycerate dehydrogenase-like enzyme